MIFFSLAADCSVYSFTCTCLLYAHRKVWFWNLMHTEFGVLHLFANCIRRRSGWKESMLNLFTSCLTISVLQRSTKRIINGIFLWRNRRNVFHKCVNAFRDRIKAVCTTALIHYSVRFATASCNRHKHFDTAASAALAAPITPSWLLATPETVMNRKWILIRRCCNKTKFKSNSIVIRCKSVKIVCTYVSISSIA